MAMVQLGWVVRKRFKKLNSESLKDRVVSMVFMSEAAAKAFRDLAEKDYLKNPSKDEKEVSFHVTTEIGVDNVT